MSWIQKIAVKHNVPFNIRYGLNPKIANEEVIKKLLDIKEQIEEEKDELNDYDLQPDFEEILEKVELIPDLQKSASVTFSVADSHKIAQPLNILNISWMLSDWAARNVPRNLQSLPEPITPDGIDALELTGTINWYTPSNIDMHKVTPYIQQAVREELEPRGIHVNAIMQNPQSGSRDSGVWRLQITHNETGERDQLPTLNVSNSNFIRLFESLGLQPEYAGFISAQELKSRIARVDTPEVFERSPLDEQRDSGPRMIDFGLSSEQLQRYYSHLNAIADYAMKMNDPTIVWH